MSVTVPESMKMIVDESLIGMMGECRCPSVQMVRYARGFVYGGNV